MGNVEYTASLIQNQTSGDVFQIETISPYPADYRDTTNQAKNEQNENARPELANHLDDVSQYDMIYLRFPNWWGDMPMTVYSFLDEYDFSGKEIHVFVCHGGSGASGTISTIHSLQSGASVDENPLTLDHIKFRSKNICDIVQNLIAESFALNTQNRMKLLKQKYHDFVSILQKKFEKNIDPQIQIPEFVLPDINSDMEYIFKKNINKNDQAICIKETCHMTFVVLWKSICHM